MKKIIFLLFLLILYVHGCAKTPYLCKGEKGKDVKWNLVWSDEFRNTRTVDDNWISENSAPGHIISSRWRENVSTSWGKLRINNRKEKRGNREWTSGSITCKQKFCYGYYECRMRISAASGINNSFWFYQWTPSDKSHAFEIDVVEAHYPNKIQTNIHDCGTKSEQYRKQYAEKFTPQLADLYSKYHIYGLWWTPDTISFYFDGMLIRAIENTCCYQEANMVLGTAVMPWAGEITDAVDRTAMIVDYVRVWQQK